MNYMKQIAEMLGVEMGERFRVRPTERCNPGDDTYMIDENGVKRLQKRMNDTEFGYRDDETLNRLLNGFDKIVKLPWKPKKDEMYHFIDPQGGIFPGKWHSDFCDIALYAMGNCFRTKAEAKAHKEEMLKKMKEVMGE